MFMQVVPSNEANTVSASLRPVVVVFVAVNIAVTALLLAVSIFQ
jgi:hypothetical protein